MTFIFSVMLVIPWEIAKWFGILISRVTMRKKNYNKSLNSRYWQLNEWDFDAKISLLTHFNAALSGMYERVLCCCILHKIAIKHGFFFKAEAEINEWNHSEAWTESDESTHIKNQQKFHEKRIIAMLLLSDKFEEKGLISKQISVWKFFVILWAIFGNLFWDINAKNVCVGIWKIFFQFLSIFLFVVSKF